MGDDRDEKAEIGAWECDTTCLREYGLRWIWTGSRVWDPGMQVHLKKEGVLWEDVHYSLCKLPFHLSWLELKILLIGSVSILSNIVFLLLFLYLDFWSIIFMVNYFVY